LIPIFTKENTNDPRKDKKEEEKIGAGGIP